MEFSAMLLLSPICEWSRKSVSLCRKKQRVVLGLAAAPTSGR
jgi:hypothetical protein